MVSLVDADSGSWIECSICARNLDIMVVFVDSLQGAWGHDRIYKNSPENTIGFHNHDTQSIYCSRHYSRHSYPSHWMHHSYMNSLLPNSHFCSFEWHCLVNGVFLHGICFVSERTDEVVAVEWIPPYSMHSSRSGHTNQEKQYACHSWVSDALWMIDHSVHLYSHYCHSSSTDDHHHFQSEDYQS